MTHEVIFPDITYSFYKVWAALYGIRYREIPLNDDYTLGESAGTGTLTHSEERVSVPVPLTHLDEEEHNDFRADYISGTARGIVIANPNAPTGIAAPLSLIEEIVKSNPQCVVIVDEAYIDFGGESALPLIDKYDNLLVVQTFSKSRSMAGMRIGYAFGAKELIRALNDVKFSVNSYTLNIPSILAGEAALKDEAYFQECVKRIKATREDARNKLDAMGFTTLPSATNFLFTRPAGNNAEEIYNRLRDARIYVRYFNAPRTKDFLRITIGTEEEMKRLLDNLKSMI
ncbi:MAG: aminotransferase class I/II-fold pyridoxal phosphate-dependent enzyme [Lachnospiraceae bacterium]|nr:aminotransferase class I/II-fold pyridoxal phosphate-dependent enzyme [Lachnospiraceae bacterium]